jgi:hypothetical protein
LLLAAVRERKLDIPATVEEFGAGVESCGNIALNGDVTDNLTRRRRPAGKIIHRDTVLSAAERAEGKKMLVYVSRGEGSLTLDV